MSEAAHVTRLAVAAVAVACGALALMALPPSEPLVTTYGAASPTAHVAGLVVGLSLLVAGSLVAWFGPSVVAGALLTAAGVLWFAPDWAGWEGGSPAVRGVATVVAPLLPVLLLGVLATVGGGARWGPWPGRLVVATAALVGLASAAFVAVDDPFLDPLCWPTCSDSALLVSSRPAVADALALVLAAAWAAVGVAVLVAAGLRLLAASGAARRWEGARLGAVVVVGGVEAGYGLAALTGVETAQDPLFAAIYLARAAAWTLLALASLWAARRHLARRRGLQALAAELETSAGPGTLASTLRSLTGDAALDVLYPLGRDGLHVGADGHPVPSTAMNGRTATPLRRGDQTVAVLLHDARVLSVADLDRVLGPAALLALDNERLAAERLARTHDVRASRRRIVADGDEARRRIERDLHDGAQQSLLALGYMLRLARASAAADGRHGAVAELDRGLVHAGQALDDLRDLAHGIHPAVLSEAGLAVALRSLADHATVPLELDEVTTDRFDPSVELAAYLLVRGIAERRAPDQPDAAHEAQALVVRVETSRSTLVLCVDGYRGDVPADIADRVAALGGHVSGTTSGVRVELPCG